MFWSHVVVLSCWVSVNPQTNCDCNKHVLGSPNLRLMRQTNLLCRHACVICCIVQVSSISGSDTDDSSDSDINEDESGEGQAAGSRRGAGSSAVVQGAQVVFRLQGVSQGGSAWACTVLLMPICIVHCASNDTETVAGQHAQPALVRPLAACLCC